MRWNWTDAETDEDEDVRDDTRDARTADAMSTRQ
jgi:hypothetical protein